MIWLLEYEYLKSILETQGTQKRVWTGIGKTSHVEKNLVECRFIRLDCTSQDTFFLILPLTLRNYVSLNKLLYWVSQFTHLQNDYEKDIWELNELISINFLEYQKQ